MSPDGSLLAWIEPCGSGGCVGAFVGEDAAPGASPYFPGRAPAAKLCPSPREARQWLETQAAALDLPIKWVVGIPRG
jgi:hypothetical protein